MPSIQRGLGNGIGYWTIKARSGGEKVASLPNANLHRFSESYVEASESNQGTQIFLFVMTGFFVIFIVGGMVACRLVVRRPSRTGKYAKHMKELPAEVRAWRKSVLDPLRIFESAENAAVTEKSASKTPTSPVLASDPGPTPAFSESDPTSGNSGATSEPNSSDPKVGCQQASSVMASVSEIGLSADEKLPEIVISSIEEDIFSELSVSILPRSALSNDDSQVAESTGSNSMTFASAVSSADLADASVFSSFFSAEMLEDMSSIAEDLKRFSSTKSIDGEIKSVGSRRSSIVVIDQELQRQAVSYTAECIAARADTDKAVEGLNSVISYLRAMASQNGDDDRSVYSHATSSSYYSLSNTTVKSAGGALRDRSDQVTITASIRDIVDLDASSRRHSAPPTSADTTLEDEETLVSSPPALKDDKAILPVEENAVEDATDSPVAVVPAAPTVPRPATWFRLIWGY